MTFQTKTLVAQEPPAVRSGWRTALRRELTLWLLLKVVALAVLWALFFSPVHHPPVSASSTSHRLALESPAVAPRPPAAPVQQGDER